MLVGTRYLIALFLVITLTPSLMATVTWSPGSTPNVTNDNLVIDTSLSLTSTVTITIDSSSPLDQYSAILNSDITLTGSAHALVIDIAQGKKFVFDITDRYNLTFVGGSPSKPIPQNFQIFQVGAGTVEFAIAGGRTLTFSGDGTKPDAGVYYFCQLAQHGLTPAIGTIWRYSTNSPDQNGVISLENGSIFTFVAHNYPTYSTETGGLGIYTGNGPEHVGTLLLNIKDQAGFIATGHEFAGTSADNFVTNLSALAGQKTNICLFADSAAGTHTNRFLVINSNKILSQLFTDPTRTLVTPDGVQHGFILGANSTLTLADGTYLDYVGTTTNCAPLTPADSVLDGRVANTVVKVRNSSALTIDSFSFTPADYMPTQTISLMGESGLFVRSACDSFGYYHQTVPLTDPNISFTINPAKQPSGAGNITFAIEAQLDVYTQQSGLGVLNVLSREISSTGGVIEIGGTYTVFPKFTFAHSDTHPTELAQYAKACVFVNNTVNMVNTIVRHDDFVHTVYATNTPVMSEPVYIGGDTYNLVGPQNGSISRPTIALFDSAVRLHTSSAFTGVDLLVTPTALTDNTSYINFYANGYQLDNGTGRALVLGTTTGSFAYDQATVVSDTSYLNIFQAFCCAGDATHDLILTSTVNNHDWIEQISVGAQLDTQYSVHTVFLGCDSSIQVGSQAEQTDVTITTTPRLYIDGNFFSFAAQGGRIGQPELAATTGVGGIFIDRNGKIELAPSARTNFSTMVTKSALSSTIDLPKGRAFFNDRVGTAPWALDLQYTQTIISAGQHLSNFTLDWMATIKDFAAGFVPFDPTGLLCQAVTAHTLYHIPVINGEVDELQIKRSRLGDQVHLLVDGGNVRDLLFLKGYDSAEAATGLVVLKNNGSVGIGDNFATKDAQEANVFLGANGLTIAADGDGYVNLHTDVIINNICAIVTGPDFGLTTTQTLYIQSDEPHEIRVKTGGMLDLTSFDSGTKELVFAGKVNLVLEPGAKIILGTNNTLYGGSVVYFDDQATLQVDQAKIPVDFSGTAITDLDSYRAKIIGTGTLLFEDDSRLSVPVKAYLGFESDETYGTNLLVQLNNNSQFVIGTDSTFGGAVQIGNTVDLATTVSVALGINGYGATVQIASQGFFGVGAGLADKQSAAPNNWRIGELYNVSQFWLIFEQGIFKHNQISTGDISDASLMALGPVAQQDGTPNYQLSVGTIYNMGVFGGGNMVCTTQLAPKTYPVMGAATATTGIFSSQPLLRDQYKLDVRLPQFDASNTAQAFFNYFMTEDLLAMATPRASYAVVSRAVSTMVTIFAGVISRTPVAELVGSLGNLVSPAQSLSVGAVALDINRTTGAINSVVEMIR